MFAVGQVVFSKRGRDKDGAFVVVGEEGEYAFLVDGERRPLARPKKKKSRHIQETYHVDFELAEKIKAGSYVNDADFRKALREFVK